MSRGSHPIRGRGELWQRKLAGMPDAGQVSFTVAFMGDDPVHLLLQQDFRDGTTRNWKLTPPEPELPSWNLAGFLTNFELGAPEDGAYTADVTIEIDGEPTFS